MKDSHISGLAFGYTNFIQNVSMAVLFMTGAIFMAYDSRIEAISVFISVFAILFGAISAG
jgi:hypothetical protein